MSEDYTPFKMKGNPFTVGGVQGTNSHVSALKKRKEKDINELVEQRRNLKEKEEKLKDKKFLGNLRRKRNERKQEKVQEKINENPTAQEWRNKGKKKTTKTKKPTKTVTKKPVPVYSDAPGMDEEGYQKGTTSGKKKSSVTDVVKKVIKTHPKYKVAKSVYDKVAPTVSKVVKKGSELVEKGKTKTKQVVKNIVKSHPAYKVAKGAKSLWDEYSPFNHGDGSGTASSSSSGGKSSSSGGKSSSSSSSSGSSKSSSGSSKSSKSSGR